VPRFPLPPWHVLKFTFSLGPKTFLWFASSRTVLVSTSYLLHVVTLFSPGPLSLQNWPARRRDGRHVLFRVPLQDEAPFLSRRSHLSIKGSPIDPAPTSADYSCTGVTQSLYNAFAFPVPQATCSPPFGRDSHQGTFHRRYAG